MPIDPLNTWKSTLADLPKVVDPSWAKNFADWYSQRILNIAPDPLVLTPSGFLFTFSSSTFAASLLALAPTPAAPAGLTGFVNAWVGAIALTLYPVTLFLGPGTVYGTPSPATTFSVVTSVLLNPASVVAAQTELMGLLAATPVSDPQQSIFPEKFRNATLKLKIDVIGINSVAPTPAPLVAMGVPLV